METNTNIKGPWVVIGDFNNPLHIEDRKGGNPIGWEDIADFRNCVVACGLEEMPTQGAFFTWSNRQGQGHRIYSKIDRALYNLDWMSTYNTKIIVKEEGLLDHTPLIIYTSFEKTCKSFKFCDMWTKDPKFPKLVEKIWMENIQGRPMYQVCKKLKALKKPLKGLHQSKFRGLQEENEAIMEQLEKAQAKLKENPNGGELIEEEKTLIQRLHTKLKHSSMMINQLCKVEWIQKGDQNSKLFYSWIKKRRIQNQVLTIKNKEGEIVEGDKKVAEVLVEYFKNQYGKSSETEEIDRRAMLEGKKLSPMQQLGLIEEIRRDQIKEAIFSIPSGKSPGPDGFNSGFFKHQWNQVGELITDAILDFFENGKFIKQINATSITVVPKSEAPKVANDYRPIACCNVIYKAISKIICSRLKKYFQR
ncbi:hypothetical protein DM860_010002 [Cuscuta australis]|uniref:Endonuclease/exonuclease/phosphatase domain-containing protein n=1 Tax=Cuscuta australis TaxID=267555 RepID=A0A328DDA7_9ASTE|nr:hypothetical protein DM860_010002 [Cuscuta australis]